MRHFLHAALLAVLLAAAAQFAQADPCPAFADPATAASGPLDQKPANPAGDSECITLRFDVPPVLYDKPTNLAWGALVLTFDRPLEGGSFIFNPICPTSTDGQLGTGALANSILLVPLKRDPGTGKLLDPGERFRYSINATGSEVAEGTKINGTKKTTAKGEKNGQFIVTIMYDKTKGVPTVDLTKSFWQSKPGGPGNFSELVGPGRGTKAKTDPDLLLSNVPEPAFWIPVLSSGLAMIAVRRRQRRRLTCTL